MSLQHFLRDSISVSALFLFSPLYIPAPISSIFENGMIGTVSLSRAVGSMK